MRIAIVQDPIPLLSKAISDQIRKNIKVDRLIEVPELPQDPPQRPDEVLLIVDQDCPDLLPYLESNASAHPNVLVTGYQVNPQRLQELLGKGTRGFILKSATEPAWSRAIHDVYQGIQHILPTVQATLQEHWFHHLTKEGGQTTCLTQREKEVLRLIVEGWTTKEIAQKLFIGTCTVETHRLNLLQKLGVKNTASLVREAFLQQLIPLDHGKHGEKLHVFQG